MATPIVDEAKMSIWVRCFRALGRRPDVRWAVGYPTAIGTRSWRISLGATWTVAVERGRRARSTGARLKLRRDRPVLDTAYGADVAGVVQAPALPPAMGGRPHGRP